MPDGGPLQHRALRLRGQILFSSSELESSKGLSLPELRLQYSRFRNLLPEGEQPLSGSFGELVGSGPSSPSAESCFDLPAQLSRFRNLWPEEGEQLL